MRTGADGLLLSFDVRFCSGKDVELFQISQESVAVTMQWLYILTMQYECCLDANQQSYSQKFYDYTENRINHRHCDASSLPSTIVTQIFNDIAEYLKKRHMKLEPLGSAEQSACEAVVDDVVPIVVSSSEFRCCIFITMVFCTSFCTLLSMSIQKLKSKCALTHRDR